MGGRSRQPVLPPFAYESYQAEGQFYIVTLKGWFSISIYILIFHISRTELLLTFVQELFEGLYRRDKALWLYERLSQQKTPHKVFSFLKILEGKENPMRFCFVHCYYSVPPCHQKGGYVEIFCLELICK